MKDAKLSLLALFLIPTGPAEYEISSSTDLIDIYEFYDEREVPGCRCSCSDYSDFGEFNFQKFY